MPQDRPSDHPSNSDPTRAVPIPSSGQQPPPWAPQPPAGPGSPQGGRGPFDSGPDGQQQNVAPGSAAPAGFPQYSTAVTQTNTMAILALIFAFVFPPLGIVFGLIARSQIKRTGQGGNSLALAGLILGVLFTLIVIAFFVLFFVVFAIAVSPVPG